MDKTGNFTTKHRHILKTGNKPAVNFDICPVLLFSTCISAVLCLTANRSPLRDPRWLTITRPSLSDSRVHSSACSRLLISPLIYLHAPFHPVRSPFTCGISDSAHFASESRSKTLRFSRYPRRRN